MLFLIVDVLVLLVTFGFYFGAITVVKGMRRNNNGARD